MKCSPTTTQTVTVPSYPPTCMSGYYWDEENAECRLQYTSNFGAHDCSAEHGVHYFGRFGACWGPVPAGTAEVQIWRFDPPTRVDMKALATGIPASDTYKEVKGLPPKTLLYWYVKAFAADGTLLGYSNVVKSTCT